MTWIAEIDADVLITSYAVVDSQVVETKETKKRTFRVRERGDERWLYLDHGPASMPLESLDDAIELGGWFAQAGTKPVFVERCTAFKEQVPCEESCGCGTVEEALGGWGGRNYPKYFVDVDSLRKIQGDLEAAVA